MSRVNVLRTLKTIVKMRLDVLETPQNTQEQIKYVAKLNADVNDAIKGFDAEPLSKSELMARLVDELVEIGAANVAKACTAKNKTQTKEQTENEDRLGLIQSIEGLESSIELLRVGHNSEISIKRAQIYAHERELRASGLTTRDLDVLREKRRKDKSAQIAQELEGKPCDK